MSKLPTIMVAPTGARRGASDHPALPITIPQIVIEAQNCFVAGAQAIHVHVRDADAKHSLDAGLYTELLAELDVAVPDMMVQITTEAVGIYSPQEQRALVQNLCPKQVSISLSEMSAEKNDETLKQFYHWANEADVGIQHILYSPQEVQMMEDYVARGIISTNSLELLFVLGKYSRADASRPENIAAYQAERKGAIAQAGWAVCAFGRHETACLVQAIRDGGKARIGFENNLLNSDGSLAPSNASRVEELVQALTAGASV